MMFWQIWTFSFLITTVISLRTQSSWNSIFRSNFKNFQSLSLETHHRSYLQLLNIHQVTSFVLEYPEECGSYCHDLVRDAFVAEGYHVYSIISARHGLIFTNQRILSTISSNLSTIILDFVPFLPDLKIDADVDVNIDTKDCETIPTTISLNLILVPLSKEQLNNFIELFSQSSSEVLYNKKDLMALRPNEENILSVSINCSCARKYINHFSNFHEVLWMEKSYPMKSSLKWANGVVQSGKYDKFPIFAANLTGQGQIIGIADSGLDINSCFFHDPLVEVPFDKTNYSHRKIIQYLTYQDDTDGSGHGTSVCGAAAGKCLTTSVDTDFEMSQYHGAAYNAKISFFDVGKGDNSDIQPPVNYYTGLFSVLYASGARIMSMSWGSETNSYTAQSRYVDQYMWDHPDVLIIYAAGNSGAEGFNTVGSPATNKNGIATGASLNDEQSWNSQGKVSTSETSLSKHGLAYFSSKGPTSDGRLKPEICTIGYYVSSAGTGIMDAHNENCGIVIEQGTSFSAPILAGHAALIRQYFMEGWYPSGFKNPGDGFIPSGALIKAILVHGGQPLQYISDGLTSSKSTWLDNNQGYGRTQLNKVLSFLQNSTLNGLTMFVKGAANPSSPHFAQLTSGSQHKYTFTVKDDVSKLTPVRITLAYTDYFGTVGATYALVNDLDIQVSNSSHVFYPVITNDATNRYDRKNNLECIVITYPKPNGTYTVTVSARSLSRTQPYALVITGEVGEYPVPNSEKFIAAGLSSLAKLFIIVACGVTFCFALFVFWVGFANPKRRQRLRDLEEWGTR